MRPMRTTTAQERLKRSFALHLWIGFGLAAVFHGALFALFPSVSVENSVGTAATDALEMVRLSPEDELPDQPAAIEPPAPPESSSRPSPPEDRVDRSRANRIVPTMSFDEPPVPAPPASPAPQSLAIPDGPVTASHPPEVPPRLINRNEVIRILTEKYPQNLQDRRAGGTVVVQVRVGADGRVTFAQLAESCGYEALDEAAVEAVKHFRFAPGRQYGRAVPTLVEIPVAFHTP